MNNNSSLELFAVALYDNGLLQGNGNHIDDLLLHFKAMHKEEMIKNITDYNIQVSEFLLNPLFNLEHSKHGIACEKLSDMRNQFIDKQFTNKHTEVTNETRKI